MNWARSRRLAEFGSHEGRDGVAAERRELGDVPDKAWYQPDACRIEIIEHRVERRPKPRRVALPERQIVLLGVEFDRRIAGDGDPEESKTSIVRVGDRLLRHRLAHPAITLRVGAGRWRR